MVFVTLATSTITDDITLLAPTSTITIIPIIPTDLSTITTIDTIATVNSAVGLAKTCNPGGAQPTFSLEVAGNSVGGGLHGVLYPNGLSDIILIDS